jgi:hypothetical protein
MIKQEESMYKYPLFTAILIAATSTQGLEAANEVHASLIQGPEAANEVHASLIQGPEAANEVHASFSYDIFTAGNDIGDMQVQIMIKPQGGYQISESTTIQKSSDWDDINLRSTATELYSLEDNLISADKKTFDQTKTYWSKIDSYGTDFWMSFSEIQNFSQKEDSELVGFSIAVLDNFIPQAGEVLGLSQLLLSDKKAVPTGVRFPKSSHHTTLANLPKYWSIHQQELPGKINVLDIETSSITQMKTENRGSELKAFGGNEVATHHYTLSSENNPPIDVWLAVNENGIPYFFELKKDNDKGLLTIKRKP